jgi:isopropylmalate/isohomocitrate dehydrogenase-like protein
MAKYKIAWLPGDGVGNDVMEAAKIVLDATSLDAEFVPGEVGWECWEKYGDPLPAETIEILRSTDCCLFGAITSKPGVKGYKSPIVKARQMFQLYANVRPCKAYPGNPLNYRDGIDIVVFRENTEGLYSGLDFHPPLIPQILAIPGLENADPENSAVSIRYFTRKGCQRILRAAFEYAVKHRRRSVTSISKANVIRATCGLFLEEAEKMAKEYPDIEFWNANIDAMTMWLIKNPEDYDVLVTTNMFGDIISDEAAQLVGGLGFASSGSIGDDYALFEPTHGSAPKYAGMYKVNPIAMLLSTKMMLDYLGEMEIARTVEDGIATVIAEGKVRTYDMGGTNTTLEVAEEVVKKM